jgi:hypothetical protein
MRGEPEVELDPADRAALGALREGPAAAEALESRVVAALRAEGLLSGGKRPRARGWGRRVLVAAGLAASLAAFGLGWWARGGERAGAASGGERYALLLHDTGVALAPAEEARRVAEYGSWAAELRRRGVAIDGEKLEDARTVLGAAGRRHERGPSPGALAGYFLLEAADPAAALAVAESCPHLRHGGSVELRRIAVSRSG